MILLATAPSAASLHPLISTAHVFEEVITVTPPNKDARRDVGQYCFASANTAKTKSFKILTRITQNHLNAAKEFRQDTEAPINFTYLATQTEGYSATDLQDLVSRAVHQVVMKMTLEHKEVRCDDKPFVLQSSALNSHESPSSPWPISRRLKQVSYPYR